MRDNSENMIELLDVLKEDGSYFAVVKLNVSGSSGTYRFGIHENGYGALGRILQCRPFDAMPGLRYRYFFSRSFAVTKGHGEQVDVGHIGVRIELSDYGREMDFEVPVEIVQNVAWFCGLSNLDDVAYLAVSGNNDAR